MSLLYSVLAFAEVLVLFASAISLFAFLVRQVVREINRFLDAAVDAASPDTESPVKSPEPIGAGAGSRLHKITGGHNEHF
jgi:hypothetical protein